MFRSLLFFGVLALGWAPLLVAEPARMALVVGNAAYDGPAALKNPVNDATDVASALTQAGWKVTLVTDADRRTFTRAVAAWGDQLAASKDASALFYYAGHGMQVDGANYLLPVKTPFETLSDIKLDAVNLADVSSAIDSAGAQVGLVVLDACRDNPFAKSGTRSLGSANRGLTVVQSGGGTKGSAIMFSTSPGDVAQDGTGRNGVFTAAFLKQIGSELKIEDMFKKVTAEVRSVTGDKQKPWINASLGSDFYLLSEEIRQARNAETARLAAEEAKKAAAARQADLDRLTAEVRTAEAAKADAYKAQLEKARLEAEAAKAAQAAADAKAAALAAQAEKALADAKAATLAAQQALAEQNRNKGKVRIETAFPGKVFWGKDFLGEVGPGAPLVSDNLAPGTVVARFEGKDGKTEEKIVTITDKAYTTVTFGPVPVSQASAKGSLSFDWLKADYKLQVNGTKAQPAGPAGGVQTIADLPPGTYDLAVDVPQFGTYVQKVTLAAGREQDVAKPYAFFTDRLLSQRSNLVQEWKTYQDLSGWQPWFWGSTAVCGYLAFTSNPASGNLVGLSAAGIALISGTASVLLAINLSQIRSPNTIAAELKTLNDQLDALVQEDLAR